MSICHPKRMHRPDVPGQASSKGPRMRRRYLGSARVQECQFVWCVPRQLVWCVPCLIDRCPYNILSIYKSAKCRVHPTTHGTTHNTQHTVVGGLSSLPHNTLYPLLHVLVPCDRVGDDVPVRRGDLIALRPTCRGEKKRKGGGGKTPYVSIYG